MPSCAMFQKSTVTDQLLLLLAGDVETNPGPGEIIMFIS